MKPEIRIVQMSSQHFDALAQLQKIVFPTLNSEEWFTPAMYRAQTETFPDGQMCALIDDDEGEIVVGASTTFRTNQTFEGDMPYYFDFIGRGFLSNHEPDGEWLYGVDINVHPDYRRHGIGSRLYDARLLLVKQLNLRGELVAGLLPGYEAHQTTLTVEEYVDQVVAETLNDPTLTWQLRNGFQVRRLMRGYIHDQRSNDTNTLIVRENPDYAPSPP